VCACGCASVDSYDDVDLNQLRYSDGREVAMFHVTRMTLRRDEIFVKLSTFYDTMTTVCTCVTTRTQRYDDDVAMLSM
jgi:hypothetical protein